MVLSVNGVNLPEKEAKIQAVSDGLYYGAGCFETFKSYSGRFLHFNEHINRLNGGLCFLTGSKQPLISSGQIRSDITGLLQRNGLTEGEAKVRIQVSIAGQHGYTQPKSPELYRIITVKEISGPPRVRTLSRSAVTVIPNSSRPSRYKLSNMLHYRQAGIEAKSAGADDALMLTVNGHVAETSIANIFWETDGTVYTPSADCDILPGVMRAVVIRVLRESGVKVIEGMFGLPDIMNSRQVWTTNSVMELAGVSRIDDTSFETEREEFITLLERLQEFKEEHVK